MTSGIYTISNTLNNKFYLGRSVNVEKRLKSHLNDLKRNQHCNSKLQNAFNFYGESVFIFKLKCEILKEHLIEVEQLLLDECFEKFSDMYNLSEKSDGGKSGKLITEEQRLHMREANLNSEKCKEYLKYLNSPEIRQKAIESAASPEARLKAVTTRSLNGHKPFSDESRQRKKDTARDKVLAMLNWAVANNKTRQEAIDEFNCSWGSLKAYLPEWKAINGELTLPKRALGEKSGNYKHGMSKEFRRKRTPEELNAMYLEQSLRMKGENNPNYGKKHSEETKEKCRQVALRQVERRRLKLQQETGL